jgi:hypothetical protein
MSATVMLLGMHDGRQHDVGEQRRRRLRCRIVVDQLGSAQDALGGDVARRAGKLVAAAGPANTFENPFAHERLQHRLEMARWQAVSDCERFSRDRTVFVV